MVRICLQGRYEYDPVRSTPEDFRRFLWNALPLLRTEARAKGLSESQAQRMLVQAFDFVHDSSDSLWFKLKKQADESKAFSRRAESISVVTALVDRQVEELRPKPEWVWSERYRRAKKAVEEFSKETHADY